MPYVSMSEATTLDEADENTDIRYRYQRGLEVASRVDEDVMASIMQKLQQVNSTLMSKFKTARH
jgi:hypothetical protein